MRQLALSPRRIILGAQIFRLNAQAALQMNNFDESFFYVDQNTRDLKCDFKAPLLVLFHQSACAHCPAALNAFYTLARAPQGVSLGVANASQKGGILVRKTAGSKFPLKYVPYLVLFYDGTAIASFGQKFTLDNLRDFIRQNLNQGAPSAARFGARASSDSSDREQPQGSASTTLGIPVCNEDVCYLKYETAYDKSGPSVARVN